MEDDPPYELTVSQVGVDAPSCEARLREVIGATLRRHQTPAARISVALVNDARIAHLNELHLGHQGPTDVLAFDLRDDTDDDRAAVDGEIIVSVETATREALERGHAIVSELALYAIHGTLHLLGYDDRHEHEATQMHQVEDEILSSLGIGPVYGADP